MVIAVATRRAGTHTAAGGQSRVFVLERSFLPGAINYGPSRLEYPRLPEQLERTLQIVEVAEVNVWRLYLRERDQLFVGRDARYERVLEGLVSEVLLGLLGEEEVQELPGLGGVIGGAQDADAGHVDQGAGVSVPEVVVVGRDVSAPFFLKLEQVVVVHEVCLDLAGRNPLQDGEVVLVLPRVVSLYPFEPLAGRFFALDE